MSSVHKESVRDEYDRIKGEFKKLSSDNKISPESLLLFKSMMTLIELLFSIFLEKVTKKNNKNSSKPSSQTEKDESAETQAGSNSKGKKEYQADCDNFKVKESVTVIPVDFCDECGTDLRNIVCEHYERRTKIDILFQKIVTHMDSEIKECPNCDTTTKGTFPEDMPGPLQYGFGIKAYITGNSPKNAG